MDVPKRELKPGPHGLLTVLTALAACAPVAGVAGGLAMLGSASVISSNDVVLAAAVAFGGCLGGAGIWGVAWMIRAQYESMHAQRRLLEILAGIDALPAPQGIVVQAAARATAPPRLETADQAAVVNVLAAIRELNANLMMTEEERRVKRQRQQEQDAQKLALQIEGAIGGGQFEAADALLRRMYDEFPCDCRHVELTARLEQARNAAEARDVNGHAENARNLMAMGKFDEAMKVADELTQRHPRSQGAAELKQQVEREAAAFTADQRKRLYRQVQQHSEGRRWRLALEHAGKLMQQYPDSPEAQEVVLNHQTLQENARLEEVRQMRDTIRDMIERRRYSEAIGVARQIIKHFPGTAAADELLQQLPRLEDLVRGGRQ